MNSLNPPSAFDVWFGYVGHSQISGRYIDQQFVLQGFTGVQVEIDFRKSVYGAASYDADIEAHSGEEGFKRFSALRDEVNQKLQGVGDLSAGERDRAWDEVMGDPRLPSFLKSTALRSISKARYDAIIEFHAQTLQEAVRAERQSVCKIYSEPEVSLRPNENIEFRKEVHNTVMSDAYGSLGFECFRKKMGVNSYIKSFGSNLSIIIEPDIIALQQKQVQGFVAPTSVYWPLMTMENFCYLSSTKKKDRKESAILAAGGECVASWRRRRYDSTRSLEAMVRADALWYEVTLAPFERYLDEHY